MAKVVSYYCDAGNGQSIDDMCVVKRHVVKQGEAKYTDKYLKNDTDNTISTMRMPCPTVPSFGCSAILADGSE